MKKFFVRILTMFLRFEFLPLDGKPIGQMSVISLLWLLVAALTCVVTINATADSENRNSQPENHAKLDAHSHSREPTFARCGVGIKHLSRRQTVVIAMATMMSLAGVVSVIVILCLCRNRSLMPSTGPVSREIVHYRKRAAYEARRKKQGKKSFRDRKGFVTRDAGDADDEKEDTDENDQGIRKARRRNYSRDTKKLKLKPRRSVSESE